MTVTYLVSCSDCAFEQEHEEVSLETIKEYHENYNRMHSDAMACVHSYQYKLVSGRDE